MKIDFRRRCKICKGAGIIGYYAGEELICKHCRGTGNMKLKLAILGYNNDLSLRGLKQLAENNPEQVGSMSIEKRRLLLKDGTQIVAFKYGPPWRYDGYRLDQLILFDDFRWEVEADKSETINLIRHVLLLGSQVPDEFQIIRYEDIRI